MQRKIIAARFFLLLLFFMELCMLSSAKAAVINATTWQYREGGSAADDEADERIAVQAGNLSAGWKPFDFPGKPVAPDARIIWLTSRISGDDPTHNMLFFTTTGQAVRVWLGSQLIYGDGVFEPQLPLGHGSKWHMVLLPVFTGDSQLTFEFYADYPYQAGQFDDFTIGSARDQMLRLFSYDIPYVITLPAAILIILMLFMYAFNQAAWKKLNVNVIIMLVTMSLWVISVSHVKQLFLDWPVFWDNLSRVLLYLLPVTANMVIYEVVEADLKPKVRRVVIAYGLLAVFVMLANWLGLNTLNQGLWVYYLMIPVAQLVIFYCMIVSVRRKNIYTRFALIPMLGMTILGGADGVSFYYQAFSWHSYLLPLSIYTDIAFVICMMREQLIRERQLREHEIGLEYEIALAIERSEIDLLTNCRNRGAFEDFIHRQIVDAAAQRFSLIMMDIDFFKSINDTLGHDAGDTVLKSFATLVRRQLDKRHPFFRWGGEEFVLYCPDMTRQETVALADSLRQMIEQADILPGYPVTISLGVAFWHGADDSSVDIFKRMDEALYRAKRGGRNKVVIEL